MTRLTLALVVPFLAGLPWLAPALARPDDVAVIGPEAGGQAAWSSERMRGARERLKDVLPGHR